MQDFLMRQLIRNKDAFAGIADHPEYRPQEGSCHLQGSGILTGDEPARFLDTEVCACPPGLKVVPHEEDTEFICASYDVIVHDAVFLMQLAVPGAQGIERVQGSSAREICIVHGRAIDRLAVLPKDREKVGDGESLAVTDDHADDFLAGHARSHESIDAEPREADLVSGSFLMLDRK